MKIIISTLNESLHSSLRFKEEALSLGLETQIINPYKSHLSSQDSQQLKKEKALYLHRTTGTNFDDFDLILSEHLTNMGVRVSNPAHTITKLRGKDQQLLYFIKENISHIPSLIYRGELTSELKDKIESYHGGFILKMTRGNKGIGVNYVANKKSLFSLLETFYYMRDQRFLIQPFIKHKKEFRVFIIKNKVSAIIERSIGEEDFRGNANRQDNAQNISLDQNSPLVEFALNAVQNLDVDYCGLDILIDDQDQYRLLEINLIPGFEQVENLSGKNIAREILTSLLN